jgi:hypothetical protein
MRWWGLESEVGWEMASVMVMVRAWESGTARAMQMV